MKKLAVILAIVFCAASMSQASIWPWGKKAAAPTGEAKVKVETKAVKADTKAVKADKKALKADKKTLKADKKTLKAAKKAVKKAPVTK
jgi:hypothetical protein